MQKLYSNLMIQLSEEVSSDFHDFKLEITSGIYKKFFLKLIWQASQVRISGILRGI